tara:strand:+ start:28222 stop:28599 length:378 start_codon:yes stop_codon:yes gene_type:complete
MGVELFEKIAERYPFITFCTYASNEYVGVIQNRDDQITTIYDFGGIVEDHLKRDFLELANQWWWESNRSIPINIFLKQDWEKFKPYLKTFINKDLDIILGPSTSLQELSRKKVKRRSITLVRKVD